MLAGKHHIPLFQIVFSRSLFMTVVVAVICVSARTSPLGHKRWLLLLRGFLGFCRQASAWLTLLFMFMLLLLDGRHGQWGCCRCTAAD